MGDEQQKQQASEARTAALEQQDQCELRQRAEQAEAQAAAMRVFLQRQRDAWDTAMQIEMVEKGFEPEVLEFIASIDAALTPDAGRSLLAALAQAEREREALRDLCARLLAVVADEDFAYMTTDELQPLIAEARAALDGGTPGVGEA